jgi:hypothetical protein
VWGIAERDVNRLLHNTKQFLITSIMEVFATMSRKAITKACSRLLSWMEEVVTTKADFIH